MARTKTTPNPPPFVDYKTLYRWAPNDLLAETSKYTSNQDVITYKEGEADEKCRVFGREHDAYVSVWPCEKGEPVCANGRTNPVGCHFFFMYSTIFKQVKLRLPLTGFECALLIEVNVAPAQLHPISWAFVRAFGILCNHFSHTPSVDVFLYFFKAKNLGKRLWLSFNGVAGRVLLTLFQQSYKGFRKKFFKVSCSIHDPTLLDEFPLYWVEKPGLKKPRSLEDLTPQDRGTCEFFSSHPPTSSQVFSEQGDSG